MDSNHWDIRGGNSSLYQPTNTIIKIYSDRDYAFVKIYLQLFFVPNLNLLITAMKEVNRAIKITELAGEVLLQANSHV